METRYLLKLVAGATKNSLVEKENIDYKKLFELAVRQQVHTLAYSALSKQDIEENEILLNWKKIHIGTCFKYAIFFEQLKPVLDTLEKEKIEITLLKGSVYRELYPSPELRTMGDVDILIKEEDIPHFEKAISTLGYSRPEKQGHLTELGYEYNANGKPNVEAFFSLREDFRDKYDIKYQNGTQKYKNYEYVYKLCDLYAIIHHVAHFSKHFYSAGAGIRFLADLYLLLTKLDYDKNELIKELKSLKLYNFFSVSVCTLKKYFDFSPDFEHLDKSDIVEQFVDYLFRDTVYGTKDSASLVKRTVKKGKFKMILKALFPDVEFLCTKYMWFKKHKWLIPIAWLRHIFSIITRPGKVKKNLSYLTSKESTKDIKLFNSLED